PYSFVLLRASCYNRHTHPLLALLFFFLLIRPPPSSTLFPYTTLFRSLHAGDRPAGGPRPRPAQPQRHFRQRRASPRRRRAARAGDRKSTRLNSSHVSISYAVFCLKKKKIKEESFISKTRTDA